MEGKDAKSNLALVPRVKMPVNSRKGTITK